MADFLISSSGVFVLGALFLIGALGPLFFFVTRLGSESFAGQWSYALSILGSLLGLGIAGAVIFLGQGIAFDAGAITAFVPFSLRVDALSAFFLGVISLIALAASLYAIVYQEHFRGRYSLGMLGGVYSIFVASMMFVVMANHALTFLFFWEVMSLSSYLLVVYEHREKANRRAGLLYLIMMHISMAFILLAFLLAFSAAGSMNFDVWRANLSSVATPLTAALILSAALTGLGIKAGMVPLHIWLPEAHPAAPSHVSALMSGVMIKTAIFMLVRFFFDFLPGSSLWWGIVIIAFGVASSILGVLYALSEHDIKRLLAFHSVENIGIILLGIGSAIVFSASGAPGFAPIALAAALFHTVNHAIFKALLFLGAGSVVVATGTRNMEEYGGLLKVLPYTGAFFLVGSLAIAAFPPLNGFASEWLTFQVLFAGLASPITSVKLVFLFAIAGLALTGGLAAAAFVKAFGITFLARSRAHNKTACVHEAPPLMLVSMGMLATLAVAFGTFAIPISRALVGIAASVGHTTAHLSFPTGKLIASPVNIAGMVPLAPVFLAAILVAALAVGLVFWATRRNKVVYGATWSCGTPITPRTEITATSFSRSLMVIFKGMLRPTKQVSVAYHDEVSRYSVKSSAISVGFFDPYRAHFYTPIENALIFIASRVKRIQGGNVNVYVVYVFATVLALLTFATLI